MVKKLVVVSSLLLLLILFCIQSFLGFGSDYSFYYTNSFSISEDFRIYKEFFTHKGPLYYYFLKFLNNLYGIGWFQYFISFLITILFSYSIFFYVTKKIANKNKLLLCFLFTNLLLFQDSNISIQILQSSFLFAFLYFFDVYTDKKNIKDLICASFLLLLSVLIRIDTLIFLAIPFLVLVFENHANKFKSLAIFIFSFILTFFISSILFGFSFVDFYYHNIDFNFLYSNSDSDTSFIKIVQKYIDKKNFIIFISVTGISVLLFQILKNIKSLSFYHKLILIFSSLLFLFIASEKNYHFLIFVIPVIYVFIKNTHLLTSSIKQILIFPIILSSFLILLQSIKFIGSYKERINSISWIDKMSKDINFSTNNYIIGGSGNVSLIYLNKDINKPDFPTNNWFYYINDYDFKYDKYFDLNHEKMMNKNEFIFISKSIFNHEKPNKKLNDILENSIKVADYDEFVKLKIIRTNETN